MLDQIYLYIKLLDERKLKISEKKNVYSQRLHFTYPARARRTSANFAVPDVIGNCSAAASTSTHVTHHCRQLQKNYCFLKEQCTIDIVTFKCNKYICILCFTMRTGAFVVVRLTNVVYSISFSRLES